MKKSDDYIESFRIVAIYGLFGSLWIYYSDTAVGFLVNDRDLLTRIEIFKGLLFIILTSLLLYTLIKRNIEKHRLLELSLGKSREQYRVLMESVPGISWELDLASDRWSYVSPQSAQILGYLPGEWNGQAWWLERLHEEDRTWLPSIRQKLLAAGEDFSLEYRFATKNGGTVWIHDNISVEMQDNQQIILRGIMLDITEKKLAEEIYIKNKNLLAHILDSIPQTVFWKDRNSVYLGCNSQFAEKAGVGEVENIVGKTDFDLPWSREESEGYRADDQEVMLSNSPKVHIIETQRQFDGTTIWVDTTKVPLENGSGAVEGMIGVYEDITKRKCIERREQSRLLILERIATGWPLNDLLVLIAELVEQELPSSHCSILLVNEAGTNLLHGAAPTLPDFYNKAVNGLRIGPGMGACGTAAYHHKRVIVEKIEGHPFWKGFSAAGEAGLQACWSEPIISSEKQLVGTLATYYREPHSPDSAEIAIVESVAHLASIAIENRRNEEKSRLLQEQVLQMQKIEAVGQLTGGIAHDFNNMLTPIFIYAEMIKTSLAEDDANFKKIDGLISSARKAKELTQKLLSFSRKQIMSMEPVDLNIVISSLNNLLTSTIPENITVELMLAAEPALILGDRGQLEQLLINLAVNAKDAIAGDGIITIGTGHIILDDSYVKKNPGMKTGPHILMTISDNGCGMDENVLSHVFEPFFTTKPEGEGTGLGLATVYGVVKQHNGYISVQSREGEGTIFSIYLPEQRGAVEAVPVEQPADTQSRPAVEGKTVLIVDDNKMILEIAEVLLGSEGYTVLAADSPKRALAIADDYNGTIDLLITDVIMPEMKGTELYESLALIYPSLPVLFISGYTYDVKLKGIIDEGAANLLPKPFTTEQLLHKIQQLLDKASMQ